MGKTLILVGGLAGAGKTFVGQELAQRLGATYIDKDTVSELFSGQMLQLLGCDPDDRESQTYLTQVRPLEYATMMNLALQALETGRSVVCTAPFVREFGDDAWLEALGQQTADRHAHMAAVWVDSDWSTMRQNIVQRGATRDKGKLANWAQYASGSVPRPAGIVDIVIDNTCAGRQSLEGQLASAVQTLLQPNRQAAPSFGQRVGAPA